MPGLSLGEVSLRDYLTGLNVVTWDVDPDSYNPFVVPIRGSSTKVLDGSTIQQFFGHRQQDFTIEMSGIITEYETVQALWTKYRQGGSGAHFELRDWFPNRFVVVFTPGIESFVPAPIPGACAGHTYTMKLSVCEVLEWFGGAY